MNKKMRTLLFVVVVGILMAAAIVLYALSRNVYEAYSQGVLQSASKEDLAALSGQHTVLSFLAYLFSILALVGFGVCLHISDKLREKEDKKVETLEVPASQKEDEKLVEGLEKEAIENPVQ